MAIKPSGYLLASVLQGAADAFAQTTIPTGLSLIGNIAYQLRCIRWYHDRMLAVDNTLVQVSVCRRSKSAIAAWTDPDCILYIQQNVELATNGAFISNNTGTWVPEAPVYVVEDYLYLQIDSTNTTLANTALIRVEYDIVRVTDAERNALLARTTLSTVSS